MRLSALFEEFCQYLGVEKEAAPRSIGTYRRCFGDFVDFARKDVGGAVRHPCARSVEVWQATTAGCRAGDPVVRRTRRRKTPRRGPGPFRVVLREAR